jgi:hypothetical protein
MFFQYIWKEKQFNDDKEKHNFDTYDLPERFTYMHSTKAVDIEKENLFNGGNHVIMLHNDVRYLLVQLQDFLSLFLLLL